MFLKLSEALTPYGVTFTNEVLLSCQLLTEVKWNGLDEEGGVTLS